MEIPVKNVERLVFDAHLQASFSVEFRVVQFRGFFVALVVLEVATIFMVVRFRIFKK